MENPTRQSHVSQLITSTPADTFKVQHKPVYERWNLLQFTLQQYHLCKQKKAELRNHFK